MKGMGKEGRNKGIENGRTGLTKLFLSGQGTRWRGMTKVWMNKRNEKSIWKKRQKSKGIECKNAMEREKGRIEKRLERRKKEMGEYRK
jgi:hypothetical protein